MRSMEGLGARGRGREMLCVVLQTPVEGAMFSGWVGIPADFVGFDTSLCIGFDYGRGGLLHPPDDTVTPNR